MEGAAAPIRLTKELLKERFDEYNRLYFEGKLKRPAKFATSSHHHALACTNGVAISFSANYNWDEWLLRTALVHEMIHMAIKQAKGMGANKNTGHGEDFLEIMDRLNEQYGLDLSTRVSEELIDRYVKPQYRSKPSWWSQLWRRIFG